MSKKTTLTEGPQRQPLTHNAITQEEFNKKWNGTDPDNLSDEELQQFKQDCFEMYEQAGFLDSFDSPYDEQGEHNGMAFKVVRRATTEECDLEAMPLWLVEFENGDTAYCYPEEICVIAHQDADNVS